MGLAMRLGRKTARGFALKYSEDKLFKEAWNWRKKVERRANVSKDEMKSEVERQFSLFADQVKGDLTSKELGHQYIHRAPTKGKKYVIFSDHHWSTNDDRQNFFGLAGNRSLYIRMLEKYYDEGYTVIENGDVEELVIFEPTLEEMKRRSSMNPEELKEYRKGFRRKSFEKILNTPENRDLYAILRKFHKDGRYLKVAGNHDYDLQFDSSYEVLQDFFPGIERPYDYVLLESEKRTEYAILHGHQFDYSTNPVHAQIYGETISESLAWAYQGPDRNWKWNRHGKHWAEGRKEFLNQIVGDFKPTRPQFVSAIAAALGVLNTDDGWEALFKQDIAWEYFENRNPRKAYKEEVQKGLQWFKFRHMDEVKIKDMMIKHFPVFDKRPKLVLGHSHEVRFEPTFKSNNGVGYEKFHHYFNTGAAGRFENLIWGLEIVDGLPKLISWHKDGNLASGALKRKVYYQNSITNGSPLIATDGFMEGF